MYFNPEPSHLLRWLFTRITWRKKRTEVGISQHLVKNTRVHLEIIKDGGIVSGQFARVWVILSRLSFLILEKEEMETNFF